MDHFFPLTANPNYELLLLEQVKILGNQIIAELGPSKVKTQGGLHLWEHLNLGNNEMKNNLHEFSGSKDRFLPWSRV